MKDWKAVCLVGILTIVPPSLGAVTIYKVTDANGNITYQNQPPSKGAGQVEVKEMDPEQNVLPAPAAAATRGKTVGRPQTGEGAVSNPPDVIDTRGKRHYDAAVAAAADEAAAKGNDYGGVTGTELEELGAPPGVTPVVPPAGSAPLPRATPTVPAR